MRTALALLCSWCFCGCENEQKPPAASQESPEQRAAEVERAPAVERAAAAAPAEATPRPGRPGAVAPASFGRGTTVFADLTEVVSAAGMIMPLHGIAVARDALFVTTSSGAINRLDKETRRRTLAHDSKNGLGVFASSPVTVGETLYFSAGFDKDGAIHRIAADGAHSSTAIENPLSLSAGDGVLFFNRFKDPGVFQLKLDDPDAKPVKLSDEKGTTLPVPSGTSLFWTNYGRGSVTRFDLKTRKRRRLARAKKPIGLAVVGDLVIFGTETDGGLHTVPTTGGRPTKIRDGFNNHDVFVSDGASVFFYSWKPGGSSVHAFDVASGTVRVVADGLPDAPRALAIDGPVIYIAAGPRVLVARKGTSLSPAEVVAE